MFIHFFIEKFFGQKSKNFDPKKKFGQTFSDFFRRICFRPKCFGLPISIPNFPKIPKIAFRKLCDEAWTSGASPGKNKYISQKLHFFILIDIETPYTGSTLETFCTVQAKFQRAGKHHPQCAAAQCFFSSYLASFF